MSHILKCKAVADLLVSEDHDVSIGVTKGSSSFLEQAGYKPHIIPDIQESDNSSFPSFKWFSSKDNLLRCIHAQVKLLEQVKPDRILGIFNFTLKISASILKIPYDSFVCGCMLKESKDILGFHGNETAAALQKINMDTFFSYATKKINRAIKTIGQSPLDDIRDLLKGDVTFLWDFPEFMPLPANDKFVYTGPVSCKNVPMSLDDQIKPFETPAPVAILSFGTCSGSPEVLKRLARICLDAGLNIIIAAGGQKAYLSLFENDSRVRAALFPDLSRLLNKASLLITHGGQISIFEALQSRVPVIVMPFQPEQAHNGICLEKAGCGKLLVPPVPFRAGPEVYIDAFNRISDTKISDVISGLYRDSLATTDNLDKISNCIKSYQGVKKLVALLERKVS